ncbi:MAG: LptA/OstA family protein [Thermodesulfobacteriota bacterium]
MRLSLLPLSIFLVWVLCPAFPVVAADDRPPISITADQMEADDKEKVVTFTGNVVGRQEDIVLTCHVMRVYYQDVPGAGAGDSGRKESSSGLAGGLGDAETEILRIECEGEVKITKGDRVAQGQKAVYLAKAAPRRIILTGQPSIWRNKDFLTGTRITYFPDEGRSVVEGGSGDRVNAVFYQGGENGQASEGGKAQAVAPETGR